MNGELWEEDVRERLGVNGGGKLSVLRLSVVGNEEEVKMIWMEKGGGNGWDLFGGCDINGKVKVRRDFEQEGG